ncbi:hypothetical protein KBD69_03215 [Candidatus Woesebacteria bacterium]|nr:hypothetical protein [Candidatus Woesebacteria bacterium]
MLGFSTGCLFKHSLSIHEIIGVIRATETDAIELNFGRVEEFINLSMSDLAKIKSEVSIFKKISIHAPFRNIRYDGNSSELLSKLNVFALSIAAEYVVFHPDTIVNGEIIELVLGNVAAIENMDKNKIYGTNVGDLASLFEKMPSARFVLDLNHVYTLDKSMKLSRVLFEEYKSRIVSYHVSGYGGESDLHTMLSKTSAILEAVPDKTILAIHEGTVSSIEQIQTEYNLVRGIFT